MSSRVKEDITVASEFLIRVIVFICAVVGIISCVSAIVFPVTRVFLIFGLRLACAFLVFIAARRAAKFIFR